MLPGSKRTSTASATISPTAGGGARPRSRRVRSPAGRRARTRGRPRPRGERPGLPPLAARDHPAHASRTHARRPGRRFVLPLGGRAASRPARRRGRDGATGRVRPSSTNAARARSSDRGLGAPEIRTVCTVLIGSGEGNLSMREAVHGLIRGIGDAAAEVAADPALGALLPVDRLVIVERERSRAHELPPRRARGAKTRPITDIRIAVDYRAKPTLTRGRRGTVSVEESIALLADVAVAFAARTQLARREGPCTAARRHPTVEAGAEHRAEAARRGPRGRAQEREPAAVPCREPRPAGAEAGRRGPRLVLERRSGDPGRRHPSGRDRSRAPDHRLERRHRRSGGADDRPARGHGQRPLPAALPPAYPGRFPGGAAVGPIRPSRSTARWHGCTGSSSPETSGPASSGSRSRSPRRWHAQLRTSYSPSPLPPRHAGRQLRALVVWGSGRPGEAARPAGSAARGAACRRDPPGARRQRHGADRRAGHSSRRRSCRGAAGRSPGGAAAAARRRVRSPPLRRARRLRPAGPAVAPAGCSRAGS